MWWHVLSNYLGMTRTVLLNCPIRLKSGQLITNQIWKFCYSYKYLEKSWSHTHTQNWGSWNPKQQQTDFTAPNSVKSLSLNRSDLTSRYQAVRTNTTLSNKLPRSTSGDSQWSILGPLLFSIYVMISLALRSPKTVPHNVMLMTPNFWCPFNCRIKKKGLPGWTRTCRGFGIGVFWQHTNDWQGKWFLPLYFGEGTGTR